MFKRLILLSLTFTVFLFISGINENTLVAPISIPAPVCIKDDGLPISSDRLNHQGSKYAITEQPPYFVIPGLNNYVDYNTNGNGLNQVMVSPGLNSSCDTIIVAINYCDSSEAMNPNAGLSQRMRYNYSYQPGYIWIETLGIDITTGQKSRFPDMYYTTIGGSRTVIGVGRFWTPNPSTTQISGVSYDAVLGLGSPTTTLITNSYHPGRDYFGCVRPDKKIAGMYQASDGSTTFSPDTLRYLTFNTETNTFSSPAAIFTNTFSNQVCSYTLRACQQPGSQLLVAAFNYVNEPGNGGNPYRSCRIGVSTNNGSSWSIKEYGYTTPFVIAGDSCQPYWHEAVAFRPGTSDYYVVYSTWPNTQPGYHQPTNNKGWKICIQSPALNGEKPVVIADYHNTSVLSDTSKFNQLDYTLIHSNTAYLSHPTLGFSLDGNVMWVAYSVIQPDTCPGPPVNAFKTFYHDIYVTKSIDGGNTWSVPWNISQTQHYDELYPVFASCNSLEHSYLIWQADKIPGCHSFIGNQPLQQTIDKVYVGFREFNNYTGITKKSDETPESYSLSQNYPNPFNPGTNINFRLPKNADVKLIIYDILGRVVTTLVNEQMKPGSYDVTWDASGYSSGVYFYKLVTSEYSGTKKMVLLK